MPTWCTNQIKCIIFSNVSMYGTFFIFFVVALVVAIVKKFKDDTSIITCGTFGISFLLGALAIYLQLKNNMLYFYTKIFSWFIGSVAVELVFYMFGKLNEPKSFLLLVPFPFFIVMAFELYFMISIPSAAEELVRREEYQGSFPGQPLQQFQMQYPENVQTQPLLIPGSQFSVPQTASKANHVPLNETPETDKGINP